MYYLKDEQGNYLREEDYQSLVQCTSDKAQLFEDGYIDEDYIKEHNLIKEEVRCIKNIG